MKTLLRVMSNDECAQVHERTLKILEKTGVRVDSAKARSLLQEAGARVDRDQRIVRFPRSLVEQALRLAPKEFLLGARRPEWDLPLSTGDCTLLVDGEGIYVLDRETRERRLATQEDWLQATRLIDALDDVGIYWRMVKPHDRGDSLIDRIQYFRDVFTNFSKHVQLGEILPEDTPWFLEILQAIFGDQLRIRRRHPVSFLICPQSPLILEADHIDAYLSMLGWDIPMAAMPMPLMGATAPGTMIGTIVQGNCEVLALLCLAQAALPGTPFIYAPALTMLDPRTGRYSAGAIENALLSAAATEMGRYYRLPVESSGLGTDQHVPGIQASYEAALTAMLPTLAWPDILVGPGLLGSSMTLSLEQLLIEIEIFNMNYQAHRGIETEAEKWVDDVIEKVGPGGNYLKEISTAHAVYSGEWYLNRFGVRTSFEEWIAAGKPSVLDEVRQKVDRILEGHQPLPVPEEVERELNGILGRARATAIA